MKVGDSYSEFRQIEAGVLQGSILGPTLYTVYTADIPLIDGVLVGTFADDTGFLSTSKDPETAAAMLQKALNQLSYWLKKWRIKLNAGKSTYVTFTLNKRIPPPVSLDGEVIPYSNTVRYLGLHFDAKLTWSHHVTTKVKELELKLSKMYWLLNPRSTISLHNKLLLYKMILKSVWCYGIQVFGNHEGVKRAEDPNLPK